MAKESFSFDIVSEADLQEVDNAVNQARKELAQRFDFKGSVSRLDWDKKEIITLYSDDEQKLKSVIDILQSKLIKRGISLQALDYQTPAHVHGACTPHARVVDSTLTNRSTLF